MDETTRELVEEWNQLRSVWYSVQGQWLDDARTRFEQTHWQPLSLEVNRILKEFQDFNRVADENRRALMRLMED